MILEDKRSTTIEKYILKNTYLSGKKIRELIDSGSIFLNDAIVSDRSQLILDYDKDIVLINNKIVKKNEKKELKLIAFNKPLNCLVTRNDPEKRANVFDLLPDKYKDFYSIGRLDYKTEGLMLFTNTSKFASFLEKSEFPRKYKARVYGNIERLKSFIGRKTKTLKCDDIIYTIENIKIENSNKTSKNHSIIITIKEGKNNEIRNIMKYFGLQVSKLMRISFGDFYLDNIQEFRTLDISGKLKLFKIEEFYKSCSIYWFNVLFFNTKMTINIEISENAESEISSNEKFKNGFLFRIYVSTGGCYGFEYKMSYDNKFNKNDIFVEKNDKKLIVVDDISLKYLNGSNVDFIDEIGRSYFEIKNPNATKNCGCGNSFSV